MIEQNTNNQFLPDFCRPQSVFFVVLSSVLLAIVLSLASSDRPSWESLGLYSMMILWTALTSSALLCGIRSRLSALKVWQIGVIAYFLIQVATFACSIIAIWLVYQRADLTSFGVLDSGLWSIVIKNISISSIIGAILLRYLYIQQDYRYRLAAESKAKIEALHARIHPHFLFNTLNSIAALVKISPSQAEMAVENLSLLMRAVLNDIQILVPWKSELDLCHQYLALEKLRLGKRLEVKFDVESVPDEFPVPSLFLHPLLENAIIHGVAYLPQGGCLSICAKLVNNRLDIRVENPIPVKNHSKRPGNGIGLDNVKKRFQLLYQLDASFNARKIDHSFQVNISIPNQKKKTNNSGQKP